MLRAMVGKCLGVVKVNKGPTEIDLESRST